MRTEAEVRERLRHYFRRTLRSRRYAEEARAQGNSEQYLYDARIADLFKMGFDDIYWVLHPEKDER